MRVSCQSPVTDVRAENRSADVPYANATDFVHVMDAAHAAGVGIIWDFMAPGGIDFIKRGGPYDDNEYMAALKSNISLVKDHPAVLGY